MAPELHLLPDKSKGYEFGVDVWALGVVMVFLLANEYPFVDGSGRLLQDKILRGEHPLWEADVFASLFQRLQEVAGTARKRPSRRSRELSRMLLTVRRQDRITIEGAMHHDWFRMPISDDWNVGGNDEPMLNWGEMMTGFSSLEKEFEWVVRAGASVEIDCDDPRHLPQLEHGDDRLTNCVVCYHATGEFGFMCPQCHHTVCSTCIKRLPRPMCPHCRHEEPEIAVYQALGQMSDHACHFARRVSANFGEFLGIGASTNTAVNPPSEPEAFFTRTCGVDAGANRFPTAVPPRYGCVQIPDEPPAQLPKFSVWERRDPKCHAASPPEPSVFARERTDPKSHWMQHPPPPPTGSCYEVSV
jgi:hypothetical protein